MLPHEQMEHWMAKRLIRHLEPRLAQMMNDFLLSDDGKQMLADAFSDIVLDVLAIAPDASDNPGWTESLLLRLVQRIALTRPEFKRRLATIVAEE